MKIKKHSTKNEYALTESGIWVRNFTKRTVPYLDINRLIKVEEFSLLLENEVENRRGKYVDVGTENIYLPNILIVSNGYNFQEKIKNLPKLKNIAIIGVNKVLQHWPIDKNTMHYYVVNNPYEECLNYLPKKPKYYPTCIASIRTNPNFLQEYHGNICFYMPTLEQVYSGLEYGQSYKIDDYRNPICAAIGLSFKFGVKKIALLCCDSAFTEERPGAEKLENGLWTYPQQLISERIIDSNLFWLKQAKIDVAYHSDGPKLKNATYIKEDEIIAFFEREDDD